MPATISPIGFAYMAIFTASIALRKKVSPAVNTVAMPLPAIVATPHATDAIFPAPITTVNKPPAATKPSNVNVA